MSLEKELLVLIYNGYKPIAEEKVWDGYLTLQLWDAWTISKTLLVESVSLDGLVVEIRVRPLSEALNEAREPEVEEAMKKLLQKGSFERSAC